VPTTAKTLTFQEHCLFYCTFCGTYCLCCWSSWNGFFHQRRTERTVLLNVPLGHYHWTFLGTYCLRCWSSWNGFFHQRRTERTVLLNVPLGHYHWTFLNDGSGRHQSMLDIRNSYFVLTKVNSIWWSQSRLLPWLVQYHAVIHGVCRMLCSDGTVEMGCHRKWDVTGNAIIVISTKLFMCLLNYSVPSVVHKMTRPTVEVSVQCGGRHITLPFCFAVDSTLTFRHRASYI
jgi:hypothetical protein